MSFGGVLYRIDPQVYARAPNSEAKLREDTHRYAAGHVDLQEAMGGLEKLILHALGVRQASELPLYGEERAYEERHQFFALDLDFSKPETVRRIAALLESLSWPALAACLPEVVKAHSFMQGRSAELYRDAFARLQAFYGEAARNHQAVFHIAGFD